MIVLSIYQHFFHNSSTRVIIAWPQWPFCSPCSARLVLAIHSSSTMPARLAEVH